MMIKKDLTDVEAIAAHEHQLFLRSDGNVWAVGWGHFGQLGQGLFENSWTTPVQVVGLTDIKAIAAGHAHSLALREDGSVWAWGYNRYGSLGDGTREDIAVPVQVIGIWDAVAVSAGTRHSVALSADGSVWSWGAVLTLDGIFGIGGNDNGDSIIRIPVRAMGLDNVVAVSAGSYHTVALTADGYVWAWGLNKDGQLGNGTKINSHVPIRVKGLSGIKAVAAGVNFSMALDSEGNVWAWGGNGASQLGIGSTEANRFPVEVIGLTSVTSISAGDTHAVALTADGSVWAWGRNQWGQVCDGTKNNHRTIPVRTMGYTGGDELPAPLYDLDFDGLEHI